MFDIWEDDEVLTFKDLKVFDDGITHINTYSRSRCELGRLLSNFSHTPFTHPIYGNFESMEGYYYWIVTGKLYHKLKSKYGFDAKQVGRRILFGLPNSEITADMYKELFDGLVYKALYNKKITDLLQESTLPFVHYYVSGDSIVDVPKSEWLVEGWETIRSAIKNNMNQKECF